MGRRSSAGKKGWETLESLEAARSPSAPPPCQSQRPETRAECKDVPRPCPFVTCRYNLSLDISTIGTLLYRTVGKDGELDAKGTNCALDLADSGPMSRADAAKKLRLTLEDLLRIEDRALRKVDGMRADAVVSDKLPTREQADLGINKTYRDDAAKRTESQRTIRRIFKREAQAKTPQPPPLKCRPKVRGDCQRVPRPCPYVACVHNTSLDVTDNGSIRYRGVDNQGNMDPRVPNCSLDMAAHGGMELEAIGRMLGLTRERVRQEEQSALKKMRAIDGISTARTGDLEDPN